MEGPDNPAPRARARTQVAAFPTRGTEGEKLMGKVSKRVIYDDTSTSECNYNVMHDKYLYEVEYTDGTTEQLAANIIAENMLSKVASEGHHYQVLTEVTDKKKDDSDITKVDGFIKSSNGKIHRKRTTHGWNLLVEWKDRSFHWVPQKDLEQSHLVELDEYAIVNEISDEPAFNFWVKETLRHIDKIISKVNLSIGAHHISLGSDFTRQ